eukprot:scpid75788/ scgid35318/ UDP-GlcNAc:betaGal beta-1,3-N-acetylglucosaminyltransferase 7
MSMLKFGLGWSRISTFSLAGTLALLCISALITSSVLLLSLTTSVTDPTSHRFNYSQAHRFKPATFEQFGKKDNIFLLILIKSAPTNRLRRMNVRNAYASIFTKQRSAAKTPSCKVVEGELNCFYFVIGQTSNSTVMSQLSDELNEFGDLLVADFTDGYTKLTQKLIFSLDWAVSNHNFQYTLLGDDDTFMNPSRITQWLREKLPRRLYAGSVTPYTLVIRNPSHPLWGRWYVPESVYAPANYPPYVLGIAYVMSYDVVVESLVAIALKKQELFGVEDAFYGIIMDIIGVTATQMPKVIHCAVESCTESWPLVVGPLEDDLLLSYSNSYHAEKAICTPSAPSCGWARIDAKKYVKLLKLNDK